MASKVVKTAARFKWKAGKASWRNRRFYKLEYFYLFFLTMVKIYCIDNSELAEFEASGKGYRSDIFVKTDAGDIYQLYVYDIVRLQQDFKAEIDAYGYFAIEPNLILVKEVALSNIKLTIENLFKQKFFDHLKPVDGNTVDVEKLIEV